MRNFALVLLISLFPGTSFSSSCAEYLKKAGKTEIQVAVEEMTPAELAAIEGEKSVVSSKPHLLIHGEDILATFPNLGDSPFQVIGVQSPRLYKRPDLVRISGFTQNTSEARNTASAASQNLQAELATQSGHLHTRSRSIEYGSRGEEAKVITLETNEVISAVVNLGESRRLVVTSRIDKRIGYVLNNADQKRNVLVEVYVIEPTGYLARAFRVPAFESNKYPKVQVVMAGEELVLKLDEQPFRLKFSATGS